MNNQTNCRTYCFGKIVEHMVLSHNHLVVCISSSMHQIPRADLVKEMAKKVPIKKLVWGIGDIWRFRLLSIWSYMGINMGINHLGCIWYHSEPLDVPCSPNQFLGWDFFCRFLQQTGSSIYLYLSLDQLTRLKFFCIPRTSRANLRSCCQKSNLCLIMKS